MIGDCALLVTAEGISQASPSDQEISIIDLQIRRLIDISGRFNPSVSKDEIEKCINLSTPLCEYLNSHLLAQQYFSSLKDKEINLWSFRINDIKLRIEIEDLIFDEQVDNNTFSELVMYDHMLVQSHKQTMVCNLFELIRGKNLKGFVSFLISILAKCASNEWLFEIVLDKLRQPGAEVETVLQCLEKHNWDKEFDKTLYSC